MPILEAKNIVKKFGPFTALDGVSLSLGEGEILGLLGPNGAGKTTLMQCLLGIMTPTEGSVTYFGKDLRTHRSEIMEEVSFSSTYTNLPWELTVRENLTFISYLYNISNRRKRLAEVVKQFRLEDLWHEQIKELSAGQSTRVNLAKAFINSPKVILLDEPTASLDPEVAAYLRAFLREEQERSGISIVFTSHNMPEVEEMCERIIFIADGNIVADDTPENLARSIRIAHLDLFSPEHAAEIAALGEKKSFQSEVKGERVVVALPEPAIAGFLQELTHASLSYIEISIEKPSLEDYFLQVASKQISEKL
ncbi:MAG: ABC transporter ATP-binding protein [Patescibacteria group bacterium]